MAEVFRISKRNRQLLNRYRELCIQDSQALHSDEVTFYQKISDSELLFQALCVAVERKENVLFHGLRR